MTRSVALTVVVNDVPKALQPERRWVMWRYVWDGKRWTKVPYQAAGLPAKSDDPSTWTTFAHVCLAYQTRRFDGIGFVLGDGWAGVDIDDCYANPYTGTPVDAAQGFLDRIPGYVDLSPSETGAKAFGRSDRVGGEIDFTTTPPTFTTWTRPRFFTITGRGDGDPTADLSAFIENWFPAPVVNLSSPREGYAGAAEMDDEMLWAQMIGGRDEQSDKRLALFRGDTSAYGGDHSRADFALVAHLAWWTNFDADRIDRMFQQSGLMRDKWKKASYRAATISKALR